MTATDLVLKSRQSVGTDWDDRVATRPTALQIVIWALLLCCVVALFLRNQDLFQPGTYRDDAAYVLLARNLVQRQVYGIDLGGGAPVAAYPPGLPLLLAPIALIFPGDLAALRWPSLVATLANAAILFWGWRSLAPRSSYRWGLAVTALYCVSPLTSEHSRMIMAEPVFLTFSLIAFVLASRLARGRGAPWLGLLLGADLAFASLTRSVGLVLAVFVLAGLVFLWRRRVVPVLIFTGLGAAGLLAAILILTPVAWEHLLPAQYTNNSEALYRAALGPVAQPDDSGVAAGSTDEDAGPAPGESRLLFLARHYVYWGIVQHVGHDLRSAVLPLRGAPVERKLASVLGLPLLSRYLGLLFSLFMAGGAFWLARRRRFSWFACFGPVYFVALFAWVWSGSRFLYPILPQLELILLGAVEAGLVAAGRVLQPMARPTLRSAVLGILVALLFLGGIYGSLKRESSQIHTGDLSARTTWLASASQPGDIIATDDPLIDQLYAGRPTVWVPERCDSPAQFLDDLTEQRAVYVLVAARVSWQDSYVPQYTDREQCMLSALQTLSEQGQAEPVYSAQQALINVFRLTGAGQR